MCTNINVSLPTVESFLLLYSLKCGCIVILLWTLFRVLFFLIFFVGTIIEVFLPKPPPLGVMHSSKPEPPGSDESYFFVFIAYISIIVTECVLLMFTIYLAIGLYYESRSRIIQYLVCRFCTWMLELILLVVMCLTHSNLIGWYLVFLMIIILEFYAFIVVYSYYYNELSDRKYEEEARYVCCGPC